MKRRRPFLKLALRVALKRVEPPLDEDKANAIRRALEDRDVLDAVLVMVEPVIGRGKIRRALGDGTLFELFLEYLPQIIEALLKIFVGLG